MSFKFFIEYLDVNILAMTTILFLGSLLAGFLGALSGLGGGLIIVPLMTIALGCDIHYAIGSSLIAVIATSTASSLAFVKEGYTHVRLAILLETATVVGAFGGVFIGLSLPVKALSLIFGLFLIYSALTAYFYSPKIEVSGGENKSIKPDKIALFLNLKGHYPVAKGVKYYEVQNLVLGYSIMFMAGVFSGLLGLGSGVLKVLSLDKVMQLPFKVSTTTSNFMIGVTATVSAVLYLKLGYIDPILTMPVVLGVTSGSLVGARLLPFMEVSFLKKIFALLVFITGIEMIYSS